MRRTIRDETGLPTPPNATWNYLRAKLAPECLIHPGTGDVYLREDGDPWEWPGYKVTHQRDTGRTTHEGASAFADDLRIRPALTAGTEDAR